MSFSSGAKRFITPGTPLFPCRKSSVKIVSGGGVAYHHPSDFFKTHDNPLERWTKNNMVLGGDYKTHLDYVGGGILTHIVLSRITGTNSAIVKITIDDDEVYEYDITPTLGSILGGWAPELLSKYRHHGVANSTGDVEMLSPSETIRGGMGIPFKSRCKLEFRNLDGTHTEMSIISILAKGMII